jgi:hypothetical protein
MKRMVVLALTLLGVLISGCQTVHYDLRPPASDSGRLCVTQCSAIRETCRGNEINRAKIEHENCESSAQNAFRRCLAAAGDAGKRKECEQRRPGCWTSENTARCDDDHRTCFSQCGGTVVKTVK